MSSFGSQMRKRLEELRKAGQNVPKIMVEVAEGATIEAVRVATESTPAKWQRRHCRNQHEKRRSGAALSIDSMTSPVYSGGSVRTTLANQVQYASYVNDGHRVDKHFVPGLIVNGGRLEMAPDGVDGGLMVGTKTPYVKGLYMKQKGIGKYRSVVRSELEKRVKEAFQ